MTNKMHAIYIEEENPDKPHGDKLNTLVFYVCMVIHIARVWINRVRFPILLVSIGKISISPFSFAPDNLVSRDGFGSPVPRQSAHLHTQAETGAYIRDSSRVPRPRPFMNLKPPYDIGFQSRVYRVRQLRTGGVYCQKFAGTGPVNLKVVSNESASVAGHHRPLNVRLSFLHPLLV